MKSFFFRVRVASAVLLALAAGGASASAGAESDAAAAVIQGLVDQREQTRLVYEPGQFAPLWTRDGRPTAQTGEVISALSAAAVRGLDPADYGTAQLADQADRLRAADVATSDEVGGFDVGLTVALMRFASDSYRGRIDPRELGYRLDFEPKELDLPKLARELAEDPTPAAALAGLDPPMPAFTRLRESLARYRAVAARSDLPAFPTLPKLRPGDSNPGVPAVRDWLIASGDLAAPPPAASTRYDEALVVAVQRFQLRHGLEADGIIGAATLRALQVPPARRIRQIELAMERLRWLPRQLPNRFVLVNIPEFRLRGFEGAPPAPRVDMEVVVGSSTTRTQTPTTRTQTPVLYADMRYLVFRPYWLVPQGIARDEIGPKAERDPDYLGRQNMEMTDGRIRQRPGANNALGLLKFILPNPFHVYLHDTPSKGLFRRSRRDFSHGCIRVADAPALAEFVLQGQTGWNRQRIEQAMKRGADNRHVNLDTPVPVYILYATVVVPPGGQIEFFDDIYGHDATLAALLAKERSHPE